MVGESARVSSKRERVESETHNLPDADPTVAASRGEAAEPARGVGALGIGGCPGDGVDCPRVGILKRRRWSDEGPEGKKTRKGQTRRTNASFQSASVVCPL